MKQTIYRSEFKTGPEATKRQQILFAADTAFALSEGYEFIRDSEGTLFKMLDESNLIEVEEDSLQQEPTEVEFDAEELINNDIFISDYTVFDEEFFADVAKCMDSGIATIESCDGYGYTVTSANSVTKLYEPAEDDDEVTAEEFLSNQEAILRIINTTLNQPAPITTTQADTLLKLSVLLERLKGLN